MNMFENPMVSRKAIEDNAEKDARKENTWWKKLKGEAVDIDQETMLHIYAIAEDKYRQHLMDGRGQTKEQVSEIMKKYDGVHLVNLGNSKENPFQEKIEGLINDKKVYLEKNFGLEFEKGYRGKLGDEILDQEKAKEMFNDYDGYASYMQKYIQEEIETMRAGKNMEKAA